MRIVSIIAAAALAVTGLAGATAASATAAPIALSGAAALQHYGDGYRNYDRQRWDRRHRNWNRGHRYDRRHYRSHRARRVCWNEWRRGHRVTVCRRR